MWTRRTLSAENAITFQRLTSLDPDEARAHDIIPAVPACHGYLSWQHVQTDRIVTITFSTPGRDVDDDTEEKLFLQTMDRFAKTAIVREGACGRERGDRYRHKKLHYQLVLRGKLNADLAVLRDTLSRINKEALTPQLPGNSNGYHLFGNMHIDGGGSVTWDRQLGCGCLSMSRKP